MIPGYTKSTKLYHDSQVDKQTAAFGVARDLEYRNIVEGKGKKKKEGHWKIGGVCGGETILTAPDGTKTPIVKRSDIPEHAPLPVKQCLKVFLKGTKK